MAAGASIPVFSEVPDQCAADARALRKWSLDVRSLPEGCEIRFAGFSVWREYRWQILGTLAVVLFQAAMITWLLFERRRRILAAVQMGRARVETGQYREKLAYWGYVSIRSVRCRRRLHTDINQPLVAIKNYALAARRRLAGSVAVDAPKVEELLDKIAGQASRAGDVLNCLRAMVKNMSWRQTQIEVGQLVADTLKLEEMESCKREYPGRNHDRTPVFHRSSLTGLTNPAGGAEPGVKRYRGGRGSWYHWERYQGRGSEHARK